MSGINWVQVPDFAGGMLEAQQARQAQQLNALRLMTGKTEYNQRQQLDNALRANAGGLTSSNPAEYQAALSALATAGGPAGLQMVMPLLRQQREDAMVQSILGPLGLGTGALTGGGAAAPAEAPAMRPAGLPVAPVADGADAAAAASRARYASVAGRPPEGSGYRNPEWAAGLPPPSGRIANIDALINGQGSTAPAAPSAGVPQQPMAPRPAVGGAAVLNQATALMASGNDRLRAAGQALLERYKLENPDLEFREQAGRLYAFNRRTGARVADYGASEDVRDETRSIGGRQLQGQMRNGVFTPFPGQLPEGMRVAADGNSLEPIPGSAQAREAEGAPRRESIAGAQQLRGEFTRLSEEFRTVQTAYENAQAAARSNTGQGDMALLYAVVKMLDPTSVVRESEFAAAAQTGSFGDRIAGAVTRILSGERLPADVRQGFINEVRSIYGTHERNYRTTETTYRALARRQGLNPEDVVIPFNRQQEAPAAPSPTVAPVPQRSGAVPGPTPGSTAEPPANTAPVRVQTPADAMRLPPGTMYVAPDGTVRRR